MSNPILLDALLGRLEALGVTVPGVENYRMLLGALREPQESPRSMLEMTPAELADHVHEAIVTETSRRAHVDADVVAAESALAGEFVEMMATNFDLIVSQFAPRVFDSAADAARWLVEAGVTELDTAETLFMRPRAVRSAWLEFRNTHAASLDAVYRAISDLAESTRVLPEVSGATGSPAAVFMVRDFAPGQLDRVEPAEANWCRWLRVANRLHLSTLAELNQSEQLRAVGVDVPSLIGPAIRQFAHDLTTEQAVSNA